MRARCAHFSPVPGHETWSFSLESVVGVEEGTWQAQVAEIVVGRTAREALSSQATRCYYFLSGHLYRQVTISWTLHASAVRSSESAAPSPPARAQCNFRILSSPGPDSMQYRWSVERRPRRLDSFDQLRSLLLFGYATL